MKHEDGKLKCLICAESFNHLGSHIFHKHGITAREYKEEFSLPFKMALISEQVYQKKKDAFEEHREKYLKNLTESSKQYQFKKGQDGHRRISDHERTVICERIKGVNEKRKGKLEPCPICKTQFEHLASHLFNKHHLIQVK